MLGHWKKNIKLTFAICQNTSAYNPYGLFDFFKKNLFDVATLMIIHMRNKPNLAISQRREYENLKILLYFCNLLELIVQIWWSLKNNSLKSFALFFSQKAFAWVSLDLIYLSNLSPISQYCQFYDVIKVEIIHKPI